MEEPQTAVSPLFGAHQCGILMVASRWLAASISTPSETLVVSTEVVRGCQSICLSVRSIGKDGRSTLYPVWGISDKRQLPLGLHQVNKGPKVDFYALTLWQWCSDDGTPMTAFQWWHSGFHNGTYWSIAHDCNLHYIASVMEYIVQCRLSEWSQCIGENAEETSL